MKLLEEAELRDLLFPSPSPIPVQEKLETLLRETLLRETLAAEGTLHLSGVGSFHLQPDGQLRFEPWTRKRVFLAYAVEDRSRVRAIFRHLRRRGFDPWMDCECLLAGQNWPQAIARAIEVADFVVPCFSRISCRKRGHFQAELRFALECARRLPLDAVYLIPVRLEDCAVPRAIQQHTQYLDLFPDFDAGIQQLVGGLLQPCES